MWQWIKDNGPGLSAIAALAAAMVGIWAIINARRDSAARSRPVMVAELRISPDSETTLFLVVRNAGLSVARNVSVRFEPQIVLNEKPFGTKGIVRRYASPVPTIAPGQEFSNIWWSGHLSHGASGLVSEIGTPEEFTVHFEYGGSGRVRYVDRFRLSVDVSGPSTMAVASSSIRGCLQTLAKESKAQTRALEGLARAGDAMVGEG